MLIERGPKPLTWPTFLPQAKAFQDLDVISTEINYEHVHDGQFQFPDFGQSSQSVQPVCWPVRLQAVSP